MYGCVAELRSEGEEEEREEWEEEVESGAPPPTANLLSLRVRHCSLSHQSPTCAHTREMPTEGRPRAHTRAERACVSLFLSLFLYSSTPHSVYDSRCFVLSVFFSLSLSRRSTPSCSELIPIEDLFAYVSVLKPVQG